MKTNLVCIVCPQGCQLEITKADNELFVTGNKCRRGEIYAKKELTSPTRMVTSTVVIYNTVHSRLPVITSAEIPKGKIFDVIEEINKVRVTSPIKCRDIIIKNVCNLGVDIVATRDM